MDQRGILKEINNKLNQLEIKTEYTKIYELKQYLEGNLY